MMIPKSVEPNHPASSLRQQAEEKLRENETPIPESLPPGQMLHELRVHQIELEMQNEELRRMQAELEEARARYFDLYDLAPVGYLVLSEKGLILEANLTAASLLGVARGALVNQYLSHFILPQYQDVYYHHRKQLFETGEPQLRTLKLLRAETPFWAEMEAVAAQDAEGMPICRMVIRDITERKQAETVLHNEQHLLQTLIDNIPDSIYSKDLACRKTLVNATELRYMGAKSEAEVLGKDDFELYPKELAEKFFADDQAVIQTGKPVLNREEYLLDENGQKRWLLTSKLPLRDKNGQIVGLVGIGRDITERKRVEDALRESEERLRVTLDATQIAVWDWDVTRDIWYASPQYFSMLGYEPETGPTDRAIWLDRVHPQDREYVANKIRHVLDDQDSHYEYEARMLHADGSYKWHRVLGHTIERDEHGKATHMLGVRMDITERKLAEQKLAQYSELLEEMVDERTRELRDAQEQLVLQERLAVLGQLAGGVSHELRNPLSVIQNAVYYLKLVQPDVDDKIKRYHGIIEQEARTAEKIITDLLDFSRIKSVDVEPVTVSELLRQTLERYPVPSFVQVALEIPDGLPKVYVDLRHLTQVLGNLVTNACQAMVSTSSTTGVSTSSTNGVSTGSTNGVSNSDALPNLSDTPGGGRLSIFTALQSDMICIHIQDTGAGITPENMKKLFEPLFTTKAKGIGLGLAVSRKLTEANGGHIEVESEVGKGSTFKVYLPIHNAKAVPIPAYHPESLTGPSKSIGAGGDDVIAVPAPPKNTGVGGRKETK